MTTPTVEEMVKEFGQWAYNVIEHESECAWAKNLLRTTLETHGNARYEEGVKAERERSKKAILCLHDIDGDTCDCCKDNYARVDDPDY